MNRSGWLSVVLTMFAVAGCSELGENDFATTVTPQVRVYFNDPGTHGRNAVDTRVEDRLVALIESAGATLDVAAMGFSDVRIFDAVVRAHVRGVRVRVVGDGRHVEGNQSGYEALEAFDIPFIAGNMYHIMHNKFFVVDDRFVFTGTGNITFTGVDRNDNNWVLIDSPQVAADFTEEFEQMFRGRFGFAKKPSNGPQVYSVGDTIVEVHFSPQENAMGRIIEYVQSARKSVHFNIFAFTKDEVGSAFIERHKALTEGGEPGDLEDPRGVYGVIDRSQLHSNGPYHEAYRLLLFGVPMRLDANDNSYTPGDYQAGGGRLHAKTMIIDPGTDNAAVLTGSFNWSSSATISNDETLLVLRGRRIADDFMRQWRRLYTQGKPVGDYYGETTRVMPGDIVFNEVHWDGWNGDINPTDGDLVSDDEFIELLNTTDQTINLSMYVIGTDDDFILGFYPGTVIGPYERFLVIDHNLAPFSDRTPQVISGAFQNAQFVMNTANDPRFLRLNLHNAALGLKLVAPNGEVIDRAGDGGPPFVGGRSANADGTLRNFSMERIHDGDGAGDGTLRERWRASTACESEAVREAYRARICATPGAPNSEHSFPEPPPVGFRAEER